MRAEEAGAADQLLQALIEVLADRLAEKVTERLQVTTPRYATGRDNPIGSARAFLDAARRGDFPTFRRGRCVAALWADVERYVEGQKPRVKAAAGEEARAVLLRKGLVLRSGRGG